MTDASPRFQYSESFPPGIRCILPPFQKEGHILPTAGYFLHHLRYTGQTPPVPLWPEGDGFPAADPDLLPKWYATTDFLYWAYWKKWSFHPLSAKYLSYVPSGSSDESFSFLQKHSLRKRLQESESLSFHPQLPVR